MGAPTQRPESTDDRECSQSTARDRVPHGESTRPADGPSPRRRSPRPLLVRCRAALRAGGAIVIKDNTSAPSECEAGNGNYLLDVDNAAVIRTYAHLRVVDAEQQFGFPRELHDVRMLLLMP